MAGGILKTDSDTIVGVSIEYQRIGIDANCFSTGVWCGEYVIVRIGYVVNVYISWLAYGTITLFHPIEVIMPLSKMLSEYIWRVCVSDAFCPFRPI